MPALVEASGSGAPRNTSLQPQTLVQLMVLMTELLCMAAPGKASFSASLCHQKHGPQPSEGEQLDRRVCEALGDGGLLVLGPSP